MFEVIWSVRNDCYIVRPVLTYGTVIPNFIGSKNECHGWIVKNIPSNNPVK